jgi:hypothetical protein
MHNSSRTDFMALAAEMLIGWGIALVFLLVLAASVRPLEFIYQGY